MSPQYLSDYINITVLYYNISIWAKRPCVNLRGHEYTFMAFLVLGGCTCCGFAEVGKSMHVFHFFFPIRFVSTECKKKGWHINQYQFNWRIFWDTTIPLFLNSGKWKKPWHCCADCAITVQGLPCTSEPDLYHQFLFILDTAYLVISVCILSVNTTFWAIIYHSHALKWAVHCHA